MPTHYLDWRNLPGVFGDGGVALSETQLGDKALPAILLNNFGITVNGCDHVAHALIHHVRSRGIHTSAVYSMMMAYIGLRMPYELKLIEDALYAAEASLTRQLVLSLPDEVRAGTLKEQRISLPEICVSAQQWRNFKASCDDVERLRLWETAYRGAIRAEALAKLYSRPALEFGYFISPEVFSYFRLVTIYLVAELVTARLASKVPYEKLQAFEGLCKAYELTALPQQFHEVVGLI
jgi:hypothetical protein